ncbi:hypothetical protein CTI12_AA415700 [Artemisia annua]|uniref:Uncharacterized protein n=1 Tax=Artemisia annua TaxID=35608 RepID=A0A2U1M4Y1_ARTAN|nr:hypothetical protein CTI12_AA415700 [Artemisia annua]
MSRSKSFFFPKCTQADCKQSCTKAQIINGNHHCRFRKPFAQVIKKVLGSDMKVAKLHTSETDCTQVKQIAPKCTDLSPSAQIAHKQIATAFGRNRGASPISPDKGVFPLDNMHLSDEYMEMTDARREMLTYIMYAVTRNYSEKYMNNIMGFVYGSVDQNFCLLQNLLILCC